jgi:S1-C subfamily serine protease
MSEWHLRIQGRVMGPYTLAQLREMRERGQLQAFHEVSTDCAHWAVAGNFDEIFPRNEYINRSPIPPVPAKSPVGQAMPPLAQTPKKSGSLPIILLVGGVLSLIAVLAIVVVVLAVVARRDSILGNSSAVADSPPTDPNRRVRVLAMDREPANQSTSRAGTEERPAPPAPSNSGGDDSSKPRSVSGGDAAPAPADPGGEGRSPPSEKPDVIDFNAQTDPVQRHRMIKNAVGLVICGLSVTRRDGSKVEIAQSSGTCFAVAADGLLITNRHVIEEMEELKKSSSRRKLEKETGATIKPTVWVFFSRTDKHVAEVQFKSENYDLAVLKIDRPCTNYFALSRKKVADVVPDLSVTACGFPGMQRDIVKVANGNDIQSPRGPVEKQFPNEAFSPNQETGKVTTEPYSYAVSKIAAPFTLHRDPICIQHTADIYHGNSGGPLLLTDGTVVGINTYGFTARNKDGESKKVNLSIALPQIENEIDEHVPAIVWK